MSVAYEILGPRPWGKVALTGETWSTPAVITRNGRRLLVAVDRQGVIQALDGVTLEVVWRRRLGGEITASPVVADVDGDGHDEIIVGTHQGELFILDLDGATKVAVRLGAMIRSTVGVADVNGDGRVEILVASYGPVITALRGDGKVVWRRTLPKHVFIGGTKRGVVSSPLLYDVDDDGELEIVVGTRSARMFCLEARSGQVKWFAKLSYDPDSSPSFGRTEAGFPLVVVGGGEHTAGAGDNALIAYDGRTGQRVWTAATGGGVDSCPTILRLADGRQLVVAGVLGHSGCVAVDLSTGVQVWRYDFGPTDLCDHSTGQCRRSAKAPYFTEFARCRSYTTPVALDVAGERAVVVGSNNGLVAVLDLATGAPRLEFQSGGMVRGSAVVADLGQGSNQLVVPSGSHLLMFDTGSRGAETPMFKVRPDHIGCDPVPAAPASITARPAPADMPLRLFWHFTVLDACRHFLLKLDEKLLRKLGIRLFEHGY